MSAKAAEPFWTREKWNEFDVIDAPRLSCRACRKKNSRVALTAEWDGDDYRVWRIFTWQCSRCDRAWNMHAERVAPDWQDRVN